MSAGNGLRRYQTRWHRWARFIAQRLILAPVVRSVTRPRINGRSHLDGLTGPFVLVTNHSSHLDAPLLVSLLPYRLTKHLAVAAAADYFYGKWWMKALTSLFFNSFPVQRNVAGMSRGNSLSVRLLAEGLPIVIFPEGTRSRDGAMKRFKPGAAALSIDQDAPVLPIALAGTSQAMPVGRFWPVWGRPRVDMFIGTPMLAMPEESVREFSARVEARVSTMLTLRTAQVRDDVLTDDAGQARTYKSAEGEAS